MSILYKNQPEEIKINSFSDVMSAWKILATMGFYPVDHGSGIYIVGNHRFPKISFQTVIGGKTFTWKIVVKNLSVYNIYVHKILLNGEPIDASLLDHYPLLGRNVKLVFEMSHSPHYTKRAEFKLLPLHPNSNQMELLPVKHSSIVPNKTSYSLLYRLFLVCASWSICGLVAFLIL